ncbi:expansin EXLX1 family cellulose-binding protein [Streptomyces adelaidensis]|uniref:expansin EXLX1 family cellulose-binding protein n=1 Tax=Streptomyces adelaidensis TaxID=2796465 RepID=UPI001908D938|nr:expansin EXLX1 family cellulose-binding protein [Streptomyces adelaidensis]
MASRSHRSARRPKRRTALVCVAAVAAVGVAASLVIAFGPDRETDAGKVAAAPTPVASAPRESPPSTAPERKPSTPSPPSPTPSVTKKTPAPAKTTAAARPSPASTRQAGSASAPLAGRIRPGVDYEGVATFYDAGTGDGACSFGPDDDVMTAAMNTTDYEVSKACGAYVRVRAAGGAAVTVRITNECPSPCKPGQLDLSSQAFAKLAAPSQGQIPITWTLLSPGTSDQLSIRYKTGSSRHWCGIQVIGHRNPVARLEVRDGGAWTRLTRTEYNYFLSEQGSGCGGAIRVTDIYGEQLTVEGVALRPEAVQSAGVQFAAH